MSKEQELGLDKRKKKFDIREEYFVRVITSQFLPNSHSFFRD